MFIQDIRREVLHQAGNQVVKVHQESLLQKKKHLETMKQSLNIGLRLSRKPKDFQNFLHSTQFKIKAVSCRLIFLGSER